MNEKPRSASSSCIEDTPISRTTPSTGRSREFIQLGKCACHEAESTRKFRRERFGEWPDIGVAIDGDDRRAGLKQARE